MENTQRVISVPGVHNCRDYGDYPLKDGGRLARGVLFRSGELSNATAAGFTAIGALGLGSVFDLRGVAERREAPVQYPPDFAPVFFSDGETAHENTAPHRDPSLRALDADGARRRMRWAYNSMPFRPALMEMYARHFEALAKTKGATLIFCAAGKDRTGLAVALLHFSMGVHQDDLLQDYLLTNTVGDVEARIDAIRHDLNTRFAAQLSEEAVRVVTSVEADYLDLSFRAITERFGSIEDYLRNGLGVTASVREAIAKNIVV